MTAYCTYNEIKTQTQAWAQALEMVACASLPRSEDYEQVLFTGCGSTYYLSLAAAALYQELTGRPARAVPGGELWLNPQVCRTNGRSLLIAVSRSGTTTETLQAVERFQAEKQGDVFVLSNYEEMLSKLSALKVVIDRGQEQSVAQTRSFASLYVAAAALCARMAGRADLCEAMNGLPALGERLISSYEECAREVGGNLKYDRFYFLGSGIRYGLACEANLKMKEMTLTHSEPFHFLEFRHGPMSMVTGDTVVVGLLSEANCHYEGRVLDDMRKLGARVLSIGEVEADIKFNSSIPEAARAVLYLPALQLLAFHRAVAKGLNPDQPQNLTAVVKLDL